jgi:hypothetical protein
MQKEVCMQAIVYRCETPHIERQVLPELQGFFRRLRQVRRDLGRRPYLNRLQRERCRNNLLRLELLEREFHAIEYREDYLELHRRLRRYLYLDSHDLAHVLAGEELRRVRLFTLLG